MTAGPLSPSRRRFAGLGGELSGSTDARPPLVLLPGLTFDRGSWRPVLDELARVDPDRRVLALDLPGQGESADLPPRPMAELVGLLRQAVDAWVTGSMHELTAAAVPYLLILGAELPPDVRARIGAALPHATVEVWSGSGHFPHLAHPHRFAGRLAATARWPQPRSR